MPAAVLLTTVPPPTLTHHALVRAAQRAITSAQIAIVRAYGRRVQCRGAIHYFFGRREVRHYRDRFGAAADHLEGVVVVVTPDDVVLTAYRNRDAPRRLRRR